MRQRSDILCCKIPHGSRVVKSQKNLVVNDTYLDGQAFTPFEESPGAIKLGSLRPVCVLKLLFSQPLTSKRALTRYRLQRRGVALHAHAGGDYRQHGQQVMWAIMTRAYAEDKVRHGNYPSGYEPKNPEPDDGAKPERDDSPIHRRILTTHGASTRKTQLRRRPLAKKVSPRPTGSKTLRVSLSRERSQNQGIKLLPRLRTSQRQPLNLNPRDQLVKL
jgi:hypothetical protein